MECPRYLDEKAAQSEDPEFLRHLASCAGCQRDVEEMDEIRTLYRSASVERYAGGVPSLGRPGPVGWASGAAALAMIALLVFALLPRAGPPEDRSGRASAPYFRLALEPWRADRGVDRALDDCWRRLDVLERSH
jgi:anti-sigma factor RsiW